MLIDTCLYNGEKDLLDLRMCHLADKVDLFVVVEGTLTFTGHNRWTDDTLDSLPHVVHLVVDDFPQASASNPWKREAWQRNAILRGLKGFDDSDLVMVSDVDEIPDNIPSDVPPGEVYCFAQDWYQFTFNSKVVGGDSVWRGTRMCTLGTLRKVYPQGVRNQHTAMVAQGGWHLSWQGGAETMGQKLEAYSHANDLAPLTGTLNEKIASYWGHQYEFVPGIAHLPTCVQDEPERWARYFVYESAVHA